MAVSFLFYVESAVVSVDSIEKLVYRHSKIAQSSYDSIKWQLTHCEWNAHTSQYSRQLQKFHSRHCQTAAIDGLGYCTTVWARHSVRQGFPPLALLNSRDGWEERPCRFCSRGSEKGFTLALNGLLSAYVLSMGFQCHGGLANLPLCRMALTLLAIENALLLCIDKVQGLAFPRSDLRGVQATFCPFLAMKAWRRGQWAVFTSSRILLRVLRPCPKTPLSARLSPDAGLVGPGCPARQPLHKSILLVCGAGTLGHSRWYAGGGFNKKHYNYIAIGPLQAAPIVFTTPFI